MTRIPNPFARPDRSPANADYVVFPAETHPQAYDKHGSAASPMGSASSPTQPLPPPSAATSASTSMAMSASRHAPPQAPKPIAPPQGTVSGEASDGSTSGQRREYHEHRMEFVLDRLRPNPAHSRSDWNARDDAFEALLAGITTAEGVTHPLICTPAPSGTDLLIIKGHRRFVAARAAGLATVPVCILVRADDGRPLADHQIVETWLRESNATKSPNERQKTIALIRWYQLLPPDDPKRELTQAKVAALLYVSPSTVNAAKRLFAQPAAVVAAVEDKTLPVTTAVKLLDQMPDPADLEALIRRVRDENRQRRQRHELPMIEREILRLVQSPSSERVFQAPVGKTTTTSAQATERTRDPADRVEREARPATANEADPYTAPAASGTTGTAPRDSHASVPAQHVGSETESEAHVQAAASSMPDTVLTEADDRSAPDSTLQRLVRSHRELAMLVEELRKADSNLSQVHIQLRPLYQQLARPDVLRSLDEMDVLPTGEVSVGSSVSTEPAAGEELAH